MPHATCPDRLPPRQLRGRNHDDRKSPASLLQTQETITVPHGSHLKHAFRATLQQEGHTGLFAFFFKNIYRISKITKLRKGKLIGKTV